jgi:glucokinase
LTNLLVADVGGTGSRLALFKGDRQITAPVSYINSDHDSFESIVNNFLTVTGQRPDLAACAVAGPVRNNSVQMTNLGWQLSGNSLAQRFGLKQVEIINDFEALAWATLSLKESDLHQVGGGKSVRLASRGILGPGTGLGVSGLAHNTEAWTAIAGEGGHVSMAAGSVEEASLIKLAAEEFGHCSAERLVSGPGLARIYAYLGAGSQTPEAITQLALTGEAKALQAIELFCLMLGTVASDLALTLGAQGGIYLAGGILPAICDLFTDSGFRDRFESKGRFSEYLGAIPTFIITADYPSFSGLNFYMHQLTGANPDTDN